MECCFYVYFLCSLAAWMAFRVLPLAKHTANCVGYVCVYVLPIFIRFKDLCWMRWYCESILPSQKWCMNEQARTREIEKEKEREMKSQTGSTSPSIMNKSKFASLHLWSEAPYTIQQPKFKFVLLHCFPHWIE